MAIQISDVTNLLGITNTRAKEPVLPSKPVFSPENEGERKVLFEWDTVTRQTSPLKSSSKMNRSFLIIGAVVALLLVAMQEFLLIAVVASIIFLRYILAATPARAVHHKLSNHGIDYSGQFYGWGELKHYFFKSAEGTDVLCVDTVDRLPGRLFLLLNDVDKVKVKEIVGKYLTFLKEEPKTFADKMYEAASAKIPLNE
jgi:hypothetical protein